MEEQPCEPVKKPPNEYRQSLIAAEQKAQDDFDKAVLSLSGGALGVSFVFVKDIIGPDTIHYPTLLLLAWLCWGFSSLAILASFYSSNLALGRAIKQCDDGSVYSQTPGGIFAPLTKFLNATGAILFFFGVCLMTVFIYLNLSARNIQHDHQATQHSAPAPTTNAATTSHPAN